jgi:hypothetical protein
MRPDVLHSPVNSSDRAMLYESLSAPTAATCIVRVQAQLQKRASAGPTPFLCAARRVLTEERSLVHLIQPLVRAS